ncbi:hypothetical protein CBR_g51920 [Chara braunii]|uniref:sucrose-phosphate phosphatase n=1 Tax=Chara braunii TaxID=69332 RepID=A0A388M949_CHABU|nr:hypothetical protein CBR_g51920 [Chara braunii]|eukprot:GBG91117.1 hypothetical protein CBR_g51920 [Chara braunii]
MNCCALASLRNSRCWGEGRRQREGPPAPFGSIAAHELACSFVFKSSVTWTSKKKHRGSASSSTIPLPFVGNLTSGVCLSSFPSSTSIGFALGISENKLSRRANRGKSSSSGIGRGDDSNSRILAKAMAGADAVASAAGTAETKAISPKGRAARVMLVSDLDHTMVDHSDKSEIALLRFNALWAAEYSQDSVLVYSTGRSKKKYEELRAETPLMTPDITILSVGTIISYGESMVHDTDWERVLDQGWNRDIVVEEAKQFPDLRPQEGSEQGRHKISFHVDKHVAQKVIEKLSRRLEARQVRAKLVYSGGIDLDVLSVHAGKGEALAYVLEKMRARGCPPGKTLVCGDSGNDAELFEVKGVKGVVVGNAKEELVEWYNSHASPDVFKATKNCAAGIIEAMQHFGFKPATSPRDVGSLPATADGVDLELSESASPLSSSGMRAIVDVNLFLERWWRGEVPREADLLERCFTGKLSPDAHIVLPDGKEMGAEKVREHYLSTYGKFKGADYRRWFDRASEVEVAPGVWIIKLIQWDAPDHKWRGVRMTVGLREKEGQGNGMEMLFLHSTAL